jgi:multiphosphoryl transfer protein
MVGIVIVSHSPRLAEGIVELARAMGGPDVRIEAAAGSGDPEAPIGTDATQVAAAIEAADSGDGVLVLMDLGSAVMSAEMAIELSDDTSRRVVLSAAPVVEGAVSAATAAKIGLPLDAVAAEARSSLEPKSVHLGEGEATIPAEEASEQVEAEAVFEVTNRLGLHARPAARFVQTAGGFNADVRVTNLTTNSGPVSARSLNSVATLGVRKGHQILVAASGAESEEALAALRALADDGFGDRDTEPGVAVRPAPERVESVAGALTGIPAAPGIAIGPVQFLRSAALDVPDAAPDSPDAEWAELGRALRLAKRDIEELRSAALERVGEADAAIFEAHLLLLSDEDILMAVRESIMGAKQSAPKAWSDAIQSVEERFSKLDDPYQAARALDVIDVGNRVLAHLLSVSPKRSVTGPGVLITHEIAPSDAAGLDPEVTVGVATSHGGPTSHGAILARSLGIPAVVGVGEHLLEASEGITAIVDGDSGTVILKPARDVLDEFESRRRSQRKARADQLLAASRSAETASGTRIQVLANIGRPEDVGRALEMGAEGVGLLRTEFLFLDRVEAPSEDEQLSAYTEVAKQMPSRPITIRTLDAGADKPIGYLSLEPETNPFLGSRGLRLSLQNRSLLQIQLQAILRASIEHPLRVMFPMVTTLDELMAGNEVLEKARDAVGNETTQLEVGIMIEVPAAALTAELFAPHVSFFSIGTNDLSQYTAAAERGNENVAQLADPFHPAVLHLIDRVVTAASRHEVEVAVCGEMAADIQAVPILVGLGIRELSMAAPSIPAIKARLRSIDDESAVDLARAALAARSAKEVRSLAVSFWGTPAARRPPGSPAPYFRGTPATRRPPGSPAPSSEAQ